MQWSERYELGIARMDETHREFIGFCNELLAVAPENFLARLDAFIDHTAAHFDQENRWMEAVNFPSCHRAEHDRVLEVIREVRQRVEQGDAFLGRRLLEELPPWFDNHVDTMDAALAFYLKEIGFDTESGALPPSQPAAAHVRHAEGCGCAHAPEPGSACACAGRHAHAHAPGCGCSMQAREANGADARDVALADSAARNAP